MHTPWADVDLRIRVRRLAILKSDLVFLRHFQIMRTRVGNLALGEMEMLWSTTMQQQVLTSCRDPLVQRIFLL